MLQNFDRIIFDTFRNKLKSDILCAILQERSLCGQEDVTETAVDILLTKAIADVRSELFGRSKRDTANQLTIDTHYHVGITLEGGGAALLGLW